MTTGWKLYRIICILQIVLSAIILMTSLFRSFQHPSFGVIVKVFLFLLIILLAIFAVNTLNNNYPDTPITGKQKNSFNQLFLLNFVFLAFLFGFTISAGKSVEEIAFWRSTGTSFRSSVFTNFIAYCITIVFQAIILVGLYNLRSLLYSNSRKQEFEFESINRKSDLENRK